MAEEIRSPQSEEPRYCPSCGTRVAVMATSCLMCGADLTEVEVEEQEKPRRWRGIVTAVGAVVLALGILIALGYGLNVLLQVPAETPTPTLTPTRTPTVTPTPTPTQTRAPTATPTPVPPLVHQVQQGDTLSAIADTYHARTEGILAMNPGVDPNLLQVGQLLLIPAGPLTPTPTSTLDPSLPTPTPATYIVYVVQPGDTLSTIAEKYGVSVEAIRQANPNELLANDTIVVNQSLVVPLPTPAPSPTPTMNPSVASTPMAFYSAPPLLSPPSGATLAGGEQPVLLQWASVGVLRTGGERNGEYSEWYAVTIQPPGAAISVTVYTRATAWRVPLDVLLSAGAEAGEFRWQVQVMRESRNTRGEPFYRRGGDPSEARTFIWLAPTPTPGPSPTPKP